MWLGGAVACGGVGVSFDVGSRVFVLSGVSVPALSSGSVSALAVSGSSLVGSLASGCGGAGVSVPVGSASSLAPLSDSAPSPSSVSSCGSVVSECGGVVVCVPCARAVFGDSWCGLVLRRWARAAGVDVARVSGLLSSSADCVPGSGSLSAGSAPVSGSVPVASAPVSSRAGRVGGGFGARVRDWGACVGVGGGVVSGGGVVASWWGRARALVGGVVDGVSVWGLVGLCGVGVVVLVSVFVLVG